MDVYATFCLVVLALFVAHIEICPSGICLICRQGIQVVGRHIVVGTIVHTIETNALAWLQLQHRSNDHLTVFRQVAISIFIIDMIRRTRILLSCRTFAEETLTIDEAHIASTEDVAITLSQALVGTNLTTMDVHLSTSEDITIGIETMHTTVTQDVVTLTTTEDVTLDVTVIHLDVRSAKLIDLIQFAYLVISITLLDLTTSDGGNLATAKDTVTNSTSPHGDKATVYTTVVVVTTTEKVTTV